jgi:hypothetical protein
MNNGDLRTYIVIIIIIICDYIYIFPSTCHSCIEIRLNIEIATHYNIVITLKNLYVLKSITVNTLIYWRICFFFTLYFEIHNREIGVRTCQYRYHI